MINNNDTQVDNKLIRDDWETYYNYLENLRHSGACNMWGAGRYLEEKFLISKEVADTILLNWMDNYTALSKEFNWKR